MDQPRITLFHPEQIGGITAILVFSILSTISLLFVAARIGYLIFKRWRGDETNHSEYTFFKTQLGYYVACLLAFNFISSVSGWVGIRWIADKGIITGSLCRSQATFMQIGNLGQAYFTVSIAVHTFNSLVLRKRQSVIVRSVTVVGGWVLSIFFAVIPFAIKAPGGYVYGESGFSCGVRNLFPKSGFAFHLFPILIASMLSAALYSIIFLVLRGTLTIKGGLKLTLDPSTRWEDTDSINYYRFIAQIARSVLWYPAAYTILLIPYSVMRIMNISGFEVNFHTMVLAYICWYSLGIFNVCLLYNTFRTLEPVFDVPRDTTAAKDMESFGTPGQLYTTRSLPQETAEAFQEKVVQYRTGGASRSPSPFSIPISPVGSPYPPRIQSRTNSEKLELVVISNNIGRRILPVVVSENASHNITPSPTPQVSAHTSLYLSTENAWSLPAPPRPLRSPIVKEPSYPGKLQPSRRKQSIDEPTTYPLTTSQHQNQRRGIAKDITGHPLASAVSSTFTILEEPLMFPQVTNPSAKHRRSVSANVSVPTTTSNDSTGNPSWKPILLLGIERAATYTHVLQRSRDLGSGPAF